MDIDSSGSKPSNMFLPTCVHFCIYNIMGLIFISTSVGQAYMEAYGGYPYFPLLFLLQNKSILLAFCKPYRSIEALHSIVKDDSNKYLTTEQVL